MTHLDYLSQALEHISDAKSILAPSIKKQRASIVFDNHLSRNPVIQNNSIPPNIVELVNPENPSNLIEYLNNGGEISIQDPLGGSFTLSGSAAAEILQEGGFDMSFEQGQLSLGVDGIWRPTLSVDVDFTHELGELASVEGSLDGEIYFEAAGEAQITVDLNEMKIDAAAYGSLEVGANVNFEADMTALGGIVEGDMSASAEAKAGIYGGVDATIDLEQLRMDADVSLMAKAEASAEIEANLNVFGDLAGANIGGQAYAEAYAGLDADIVLDPQNGDFYSEGQLGAFAGAGAGGQIGVNLFGDALTFGVQGGVAASAGVGADYVVGFKDGTFVLDWSVMAGAKAGGYAGTYMEVDVAGVSDYIVGEGVNMIDGAFEMASDTLPGPIGDLAGDVGDFVTDGIQSAGDAIADAGLSALDAGVEAVGNFFQSF